MAARTNSPAHCAQHADHGNGPTLESRFRGCLLAGAIGDALGAPVDQVAIDLNRATHDPDALDDNGAYDWGRYPGV